VRLGGYYLKVKINLLVRETDSLVSALDSWVVGDLVGISFDSDSVRSSFNSSILDPG
jgi:type IV secretory pathway VirB4 component